MSLYTHISHGRLFPDRWIPGGIPIASDGGRGQLLGVGTGVSVFDVPDSEVVKAINESKPWPAVNAAKCKQFFAKLDPSYPFVSNVCEGWERDPQQVKFTATFLAAAKARKPAAVGHYGFPNLPRFYATRQEWRDTNDRAMDAWRGSLTWLNPSLYARKEVAAFEYLPHTDYIELVELLRECERLAKRGHEKIVPYFSHLAYDGLTETSDTQNRQRVELAEAFGLVDRVFWTDKADTRMDRIRVAIQAVGKVEMQD